MLAHQEQRILPYRPDQLFDLVLDIGRYPEFLPWCRASRILSQNEKEIMADLVIGYKLLREQFTSRVTFTRPHEIQVHYMKGPLDHLENRWLFKETENGQTQIDFCIRFSFKSRTLERIVHPLFDYVVEEMVEAFDRRAAELYGIKLQN